jgi:hypothetical protein
VRRRSRARFPCDRSIDRKNFNGIFGPKIKGEFLCVFFVRDFKEASCGAVALLPRPLPLSFLSTACARVLSEAAPPPLLSAFVFLPRCSPLLVPFWIVCPPMSALSFDERISRVVAQRQQQLGGNVRGQAAPPPPAPRRARWVPPVRDSMSRFGASGSPGSVSYLP